MIVSYIATAEAVTMILGPAIGSFLYELFGFQTVFLIVASFDFIVAFVVIFMVPKEVDINDQSLESTSEQNSIAVIYNQATNLINQKNWSSDDGNVLSITKVNHHEEIQLQSVRYLKLFFNPIILFTSIASFISCFEYCYIEPILAIRPSEMGLTQWHIGAFFCIQGLSYTIATLFTSFFTDRFDIKGIIWKSMLLCGFVNFMVGPSNSLPNSVVIMGFGQFLNSGLEVYFMITCLPVMIKEGEKMYPNNKLEVADKASGMVNWMFDLGQAFGPIYGSYMTAYFGFRNTADSVAFMLIAYSIVYFLVVKYFDMSQLTQDKIEIDEENKQNSK